MKLFRYMKDGGPESKVWGFWLLEWKPVCSVVLLHFKHGSRDAYHSHAFSAVSWLIKGKLTEHTIEGTVNVFTPGLKPIWTPRKMFHQVFSEGNSLVLSFRGPWSKTWREWLPKERKHVVLTHGRKVVRCDDFC